ncbi:MAG: Rrf2 family transcriptional regulator [Rubrivivax sp.]|jgi:Rrf2 family protein|nr:Rrf2 family transcriptional regulator [Rubrivivax sp.]
MRLQKNTSLALYSVLEFARDPTRHISAAEIAAKQGASPHHLAKVLAELARHGIVESVRGAGGGYRFVGNARRLTLMDVIALFEEITPAGPEHPAGTRAEPVEQALAAVLSEIDENAKATFRSITLATMLSLIDRQQRAAAEPPQGLPQV